MRKTLNQFLTENTKTNTFRLKFAFEPNNESIEKIKRILDKYDLLSFGPVKRTIFQSKPLEFYELDCGEIFMIDVELGRPVSQEILLYDITSFLRVSEALVRVRNKNEPVQFPMGDQEDDISFDEEYIPRMSDPEYSEVEPIDIDLWAGDTMIDNVVKTVIADRNSPLPVYAEYMHASFGHDIPKVKSDVPRDAGPTKK